MSIKNLWSTPVLEIITDIDGEKIITEIENNPNWKTDFCIGKSTGELSRLFQVFQDSAYAVASETNIAGERLFCPGMVGMETHTFGDSMELHYHLYAAVVCVFYPRANEDSGDLVLVDPRGSHFLHTQPFSKSSISIKPSSGKLVAFPANINHKVKSNFTNFPRYSIASAWYLGQQEDYIRYFLQQTNIL